MMEGIPLLIKGIKECVTQKGQHKREDENDKVGVLYGKVDGVWTSRKKSGSDVGWKKYLLKG